MSFVHQLSTNSMRATPQLLASSAKTSGSLSLCFQLMSPPSKSCMQSIEWTLLRMISPKNQPSTNSVRGTPQQFASFAKSSGLFVFPLRLTSSPSHTSFLHHFASSPSQCHEVDSPGAYITSSKLSANAMKATPFSLTSQGKVHDSLSLVKAAYITTRDTWKHPVGKALSQQRQQIKNMWQLLVALVSTDHKDTWWHLATPDSVMLTSSTWTSGTNHPQQDSYMLTSSACTCGSIQRSLMSSSMLISSAESSNTQMQRSPNFFPPPLAYVINVEALTQAI